MSEIYVTGHKNPDTDSIVAAIAYANLRNSLGEREHIPVRIGGVNDETRHILDRFGFEAPEYLNTIRTQVRDLDYDVPHKLNHSVTIKLAWNTMREDSVATIPIVNDDGSLYGVLSAGDIASYDMQMVYESSLLNMPLFNLLSVLEARVVNEYNCIASAISGDLCVALPAAYDEPESIDRRSVVICGNQPELVDRLIERGVNGVILCNAEILPRWTEAGEPTVVISTPLDPRMVIRLIHQATPVRNICKTGDIVCFHLSDYLDDVREVLLKSRYRAYPILDDDGKVCGTLSRYHLLRPRRKQLVLVDHNESSQSISGLEQAEIMEIIDHHRLGDIQTSQPVSVRNEPVGSTNTIITAMYQEFGVVPSPQMAGLMVAAILSDTVMFKSPTCTKKDIAMAERLAKIARISLEDLGKEIFSVSGGDDKSAEELFKTDYKQFYISGQNIGMSQITCVDASHLLDRRDEFFAYMDKLKGEKDFDFVILMLTDVLSEGSHLLYTGSDDIIRQAFNVEPKDKCIYLPGVMSRKKQVIPMLTALWG